MSQEIVSHQDETAIKQRRNDIAVRHGLPAIGSRMLNEHGIEWLVDGHSFLPDLTSLARDGGQVTEQDPRDLLPVIIPQNASQRLKDFWIETDRCTSKYLVAVDTMPGLRPHQAHPDGHWVDAWSSPDAIHFFLDANHVDETIFAHEIAHVWIDLVEDCEDYRVLRDLSDTSRVRQLQHVQSFVLDRKVNEVLRERGFDFSLIEQQQQTAILSLTRAVIAGYRPPYEREAVAIALLIGSILLEQENGLHDTSTLSLVLCYDGTIEGALRLLRQDIPEIYALAESLAKSVCCHGYANRRDIRRTIDECVQAAFEFTGDPLDMDAELEEVPPTESYRDKWPNLFQGWPVQAKLEVGKAMAKNKIGSDVTWRVSYTYSGDAQIEFQDASDGWTKPVVLHHAPSLPTQLIAPSPHPQAIRPFRPSSPQHSGAKPARVPVSPIPKPSLPRTPFASPPVPQQTSHLPSNQVPRHFGRNYMPGLGLWLSRARLAETGVEHPYNYAFNNPVNYIDPNGLYPARTGWVKGRGDSTSPYGLGGDWLTGRGPRVRNFTVGDPLLEDLRKHEGITKTLNDARWTLGHYCQKCNAHVPPARLRHTLAGASGVWKYIRDYSVIFSGGKFGGNLAATVIGSYGGRWAAENVDCCKGTATLAFRIWNAAGAQSGTRFPVLGYQGRPSIEDLIKQRRLGVPGSIYSNNPYGKGGPLGTIYTFFYWKQQVRFQANKNCCKCKR